MKLSKSFNAARMASNQEISQKMFESNDSNNPTYTKEVPEKGHDTNENSDQINFERLTPEKIILISKKLEESTREGVGRLRHILPHNRIVNLLDLAMDILKMEPTLLDLKITDKNATVTVVGDTHGQYHDVLKMFEVAGIPSEKSYFIFNGDYVDRGAWGLETLILLICWKLCLPENVFLIRGNHESVSCTTYYGFKGELELKYGKEHKFIYKTCKKLFSTLPLSILIQNKTIVMHGGLFRKPKKRRNFKKKRGIKNVFKTDENNNSNIILGTLNDLRLSNKGGLDPNGSRSSIISTDILWSDPIAVNGIYPSTRGLGMLFGPDITQNFLFENNLNLIIRSHEGPDARFDRSDMPGMINGYSIDHDVQNGKLVTVFSAPDYPQFQNTPDRYLNLGAVIILKYPDYHLPIFKTFSAVYPRPNANPCYDLPDHALTDDSFCKEIALSSDAIGTNEFNDS